MPHLFYWDIKQTFLKLIGPGHLDAGFTQRIKDLSLKGGSLWQSHILTREPLRRRPQFQGGGTIYPCDSREIYFENVADVMSWQGSPRVPPERLLWNLAARSEMYENSFNEYYLPEAILKFRQGFGRLIRSQSDHGVVAILDKRVMTKQYGRMFIDSLPQCTLRQGSLRDLPRQAGEWLGM